MPMRGRSNDDGSPGNALKIAQRKWPEVQILEFIGITMEEGLKPFTATSKVRYNFKHVVGSYQSEDGPLVASTSNDQTKLSKLTSRKKMQHDTQS